MKRALVITVAAFGFVGFAASGASAAPDPVVTVEVGDDNVRVGTGLPGQPLIGASADVSDAQACVGFSYQTGTCTPGGLIHWG